MGLEFKNWIIYLGKRFRSQHVRGNAVSALISSHCLASTAEESARPRTAARRIRGSRDLSQVSADDPSLAWLNRYANKANPDAHRRKSSQITHQEFGRVDVLAVGAGSTGTLMGCVDYFRERSPCTRIIAVDVAGSVTFGGPAGPRHVPGLEAGRRPEIMRDDGSYETCVVGEGEGVAICREIARWYGVHVSGSTGTVLAALRRVSASLTSKDRLVAVSPDLDDRYLDAVYSDRWTSGRFPAARMLAPDGSAGR